MQEDAFVNNPARTDQLITIATDLFRGALTISVSRVLPVELY